MLDSGSLTADTEIICKNSCGHFYFEDESVDQSFCFGLTFSLFRYIRGCIKICNDDDGCNKSGRIVGDFSGLLVALAIAMNFQII